MRALHVIGLAGILSACPARPPVVHPEPPEKPQQPDTPDPTPADVRAALDEAVAGVDDRALAALLRDHWAWVLDTQPLRATRLGVHSADGRLPDLGHAAVEESRNTVKALLARARALTKLNASDEVTRSLLVDQLEASVASDVCDFHQWSLSPRSNPVTEYNDLHELTKLTDPAAGAKLLERYGAVAGSIDAEIANLRRGAGRGLYATAESARRVLAMVDKQLAEPVEEWPMMQPATKEYPGWDVASRDDFRATLRAAVVDAIKPALERYRAFLASEIMPHARTAERSGLGSLPELGQACYRARIRAHTTLTLSAQEIHDIGKREIARIDAELTRLGKRALGTTTLATTLAKLRTDTSLYFASEDEVAGAAQSALDDAKAKMGDYFGILPKTDCVIRRIPAYEAPYTTIAYYKPPHADGSKPGEYFVNVYQPRTRPRFEARVLAVHESIPGHHLQIAISKEQQALPAFRKHGGVTAYVEGWALYTERLGEEMGLYRDDLDRIGVASFDAWRAGRLVVDTGIHALGWSRDQAIAYLTEHTALSPENIDNEVDRYIVWPGQALAYKLGQLEIRELRTFAEKELGTQFSLKSFHDAVLSLGPVSLPVLRARIMAHVTENLK